MSGGSFDYVGFKIQERDFFNALYDLKRIERWLREQTKHDAADEILKLILEIETAERRLKVIGDRIYEILHSAEWWCSCDIGEDTFDKRVKEVLG